MKEEDAEKLSIVLMQANALLDQAVAFVKDKDSKENFEQFRLAAGKAMGEIYLEMEEPLWKRFPKLRPEPMDGSYKVNPKIFEPKFYEQEK